MLALFDFLLIDSCWQPHADTEFDKGVALSPTQIKNFAPQYPQYV